MVAEPILAAGGVLERETPEGLRIAVVRRSRYQDRGGSAGDLVLPKGKLEPGEDEVAAALREVEEETGCRGRVVGSPQVLQYPVGGRTKRVAFFRMIFEAEGGTPDADEVTEVLWIEPSRALQCLTYENERNVVAGFHGEESGRSGH